ncbi:hypothetical protein KFK09_025899 [Dendrobium nobile]|uniref:Uncharacterized protein n=1 Tax=Dendrobium nobile TaxID=94219 RepID=A0A8T3A6E7_DENNO|nr:hypothetical protein KFK09_025899 [Dendrobium nobile]
MGKSSEKRRGGRSGKRGKRSRTSALRKKRPSWVGNGGGKLNRRGVKRRKRNLAPYNSLCAHGTRTDVLTAPEQISSDPEQNRYQIFRFELISDFPDTY